MERLLILSNIVAGVCLYAIPVEGQFQITIAPGSAKAITIVDDDVNDTNRSPNIIAYNAEIVFNPTNKFIVDIKVSQHQTVNTDNVKLSTDYLTIVNTGSVPLTSSITAQSSIFDPVGPPFYGRAHLDGKFKHFKADPIENASASLSTSALMPLPAVLIGTVTIAPVVGVAPPVAFGPLATPPNPDVLKTLTVGVTQLGMQLNFSLGPNDRMTTPGSAFVEGYKADRVLTVNSTADQEDGLLGDERCDTGSVAKGLTGVCTLRAALSEADQKAVVTAIHFNIPGTGVPTIAVQPDKSMSFGSMGALQQVIVDGTTQPAGMVQLNGTNASLKDAADNPIVGLDLVGQKASVFGMIINGFPSHAIQIRQSGAPFGGSNILEENAIGIDKTGLALGNGGDGVHISQQPDNQIVDNVISHNAGEGVSVDGSVATGNRIHSTMEANGDLGILLSNNGNHLQPAPVISSASEDGSDLTISGTLHSTPSTLFNFDIFVNELCGRGGQGQGKTLLGSTSAMTDASGSATFKTVLAAGVSEGLIATATATDPAGNTSEFSACAAISAVTPPTLPPMATAGTNQTVPVGTLVTLNGTGSSDPNVPPLPLTFTWTQSSGPAVTLTGANTATPSFTPTQAGTYVFSLAVSNGAASDSASVTITVTGSEPGTVALIEGLIAEVESFGLDRGLERRLVASLNQAENDLKHQHTSQAIDRLLKFIGDVKNPTGKTIPRAQAEELIKDALAIIGTIQGGV